MIDEPGGQDEVTAGAGVDLGLHLLLGVQVPRVHPRGRRALGVVLVDVGAVDERVRHRMQVQHGADDSMRPNLRCTRSA